MDNKELGYQRHFDIVGVFFGLKPVFFSLRIRHVEDPSVGELKKGFLQYTRCQTSPESSIFVNLSEPNKATAFSK